MPNWVKSIKINYYADKMSKKTLRFNQHEFACETCECLVLLRFKFFLPKTFSCQCFPCCLAEKLSSNKRKENRMNADMCERKMDLLTLN